MAPVLPSARPEAAARGMAKQLVMDKI